MMTYKAEISSRRQLNYTWRIKGINHEEPRLFSKKFMTHKKIELLQVGMKMLGNNDSHPAILFLLTTNLHKVGLKVMSVSYFKYSEQMGSTTSKFQEIEMNPKILTNGENNYEDVNDGSTGIQLFTARPLNLFEDDETDFTFIFEVNFTGIVDNFRVHQIDDLLSQQLHSSIKNQNFFSSFKLITTDGLIFRVHKWILVARSPVFAALFSSNEEIGSIHLAVDCKVNELTQFIHFIYNGKLIGSVSHELMQLAAKYEIKTLQDVCETALQDAYSYTMDKMAVIAWHLDSGSQMICNEKNESDVEMSEKKCQRVHVSIFTCTWNVQDIGAEENQEPIKRSVSFKHGGKKMFRAWLEMTKSPDHPEKYTFSTLKFLSYGHESMGYKIYQVTCSVDAQDQNCSTQQQILMTRTEPKDNKTLQVFTSPFPTELTTPISCPLVITFHAKLESTVVHFVNVPVDVTWSNQIWSAAVNRKLTDVEFLVGEESYGAHRSLISARSPVFAAMFASGMKEAETGQVRIEDVDPTTFQHFLKFLYTGMLEPSAMDEELFTVADKYQVATLMELCRPATKPAGTEDGILKAFLSL